jgi:hypothetical protein
MFDWMFRRHIPDGVLKRYRAGLLEKLSHDMLENHLLLCPICQLQMSDMAPDSTAEFRPFGCPTPMLQGHLTCFR